MLKYNYYQNDEVIATQPGCHKKICWYKKSFNQAALVTAELWCKYQHRQVFVVK